MAGVVLGYLKYRLGFDAIEFNKGTTEAEARLAKMQKAFDRQAKALTNFGAKLTAGLTLPLAAFGAASFSAATDAAELQSAFDATFGKMAADMNAWAVATGNAIGRSTQELQRAGKEFGIFFNTAVDPAKSAAMSKQFTLLAEDLASFYNVDVEAAIEKLRSGLAGESEPLRAFGVFLTEAAVKAEAMRLGLTGVGNELTEQEKIVARYNLIMAQTKNAQGDLARTSGSTANQMRAASAAFEELRVIVGTKLLPAITPLIQKIAEAVQWFTQLPQPVQNVALGIAAFSAAVGPVLIGIGSLLPLIIKLGPVLLALTRGFAAATAGVVALGGALLPLLANPIVLGAAAVIGAIYLAWKNWDKIAPIVQKMVAGVTSFLKQLAAPLLWVINRVKDVNNAFFKLYDNVVGHSYVPDMVDGIAAQMARLDSVMVKPVTAATSKSAEAFKQLQTDTLGLLNGLFPEAAAKNELARQVDLLTEAMHKGIITSGQYFEALDRLDTKFAGQVGSGSGIEDPGLQVESDTELLRQMGETMDAALGGLRDDAHRTRNEVIQDVAAMSEGVTQSLGQMIDSFRSGKIGQGLIGLLDTLGQIVGLLGQAGVIKLPSTGMSVAGARASGGPVVGGKTYLVGERGPEFITPKRSGFVHPNGSGPSTRVEVVPSRYFDVVVRKNAADVAAPMSAQAAMAGAAGGHAAVMQGARRRFPGG